jgi:hypothetical protein
MTSCRTAKDATGVLQKPFERFERVKLSRNLPESKDGDD